MAEERVRIEIGFVGGTIVAAQMSVADAERLHHKLAAGGDGTVDVELEDGTCTVVALARPLPEALRPREPGRLRRLIGRSGV